ncbi:MAG: hypothetical protein R2838_01755 [Caldilineaceae bacterium]
MAISGETMRSPVYKKTGQVAKRDGIWLFSKSRRKWTPVSAGGTKANAVVFTLQMNQSRIAIPAHSLMDEFK